MTAAVTIGGTKEDSVWMRAIARSVTIPIRRLIFQRERRLERRWRCDTAYLARRMSLYSELSNASSAEAL
eukprot:14676066-Heterocapsa_arctica.AAC.1